MTLGEMMTYSTERLANYLKNPEGEL